MADLITSEYYTREEWQALKPETIIAAYHDDSYFGFYDTGSEQKGFILNFRYPNQGIVGLDISPTAAYSHAATDALYLQVGDDIKKFGQGADLTYTWRSKDFISTKPTTLTAANVSAKDYPVGFKLYVDDVLKYSKQVNDGNVFRLPSGYLSSRFSIELSSVNDVYYADIASSVPELAAR